VSSPIAAFERAQLRVIERNWLSANQIIFYDSDHAGSVVDTGYIKHQDMTVALIREALAGRNLTRILNTHLHSDHCGGNALLVKTFGAELLLPSASFDAAKHWTLLEAEFASVAQRCERFTPTGKLHPGRVMSLGTRDWEIHSAPGHDPNSIILFEPIEKILISADALWENGFGIIFPEIGGQSGFREQQSILDHIEELAPRIVIPGHGKIFTDVNASLDRARRRLAALRAEPVKHACHSLKALIQFLMLELESTTRDGLVLRVRDATLFHNMCALIQMPQLQAVNWAIDSLVAGGHLCERDDRIALP
jgi:glyoxylase-like metal-dependent hydrolase (beta-lactamase superfamily II)